ncbi:MAG TPA: hypothetical protein VH394_22760, partial [Thermoanaerobaculia bacterium]|nr:hypothetical protein [Thermoanaerobaculia bacterium]
MPTPEDFCRTWIFKSNDPNTQRAYPDGRELAIGEQFAEEGRRRFMLAWTDMDKVLHVLTGLTLDDQGGL